MYSYPLLFEPVFKDYVWGGRNLETIIGRQIPPGIVAESWDIAAHANGNTTVSNGAWTGATLNQLLEQMGESLVGRFNRDALARGRFPILIKLLDAHRWLSVQVHPDDTYALREENDLGKTEMWVIVHAEPGAQLIFGFASPMNRTLLAHAIEAGTVEDHLHHLPVRAGDVIFVPSGSIHALGPGIIVAEIQQNSDVTYRLYDWGRDRPLHIKRAQDVVDYNLVRPGPFQPVPISVQQDGIEQELIGTCPYFQTDRLRLRPGAQLSAVCDGSTYVVWGVMQGTFDICWANNERMSVSALTWTLLPADMGDYQIVASSACELLRVITPNPTG